MNRCIVIGANGYLGSHMSKFLVENGISTDCYDYSGTSVPESPDCRNIDVTDIDNLSRIDWDVDAVFNFAGLTGTHASFQRYSQFIGVNEIGLVNVLEAIKNSGVKPRIVFPSTRLVYRGSEFPLKEDSPKEAKTIYAANKISCELMLDAYSNLHDLSYTVFRVCVPYGSTFGSSYSYGTTGFFINQCREKGVVRLFGDGELRRTFTHVEDICRQIYHVSMMSESGNQIYNIAGEDYSLKEVAGLIAQRFNARLEFMQWPETDLRIESGHTVFDHGKIEMLMAKPLEHQLKYWIEGLNVLNS